MDAQDPSGRRDGADAMRTLRKQPHVSEHPLVFPRLEMHESHRQVKDLFVKS